MDPLARYYTSDIFSTLLVNQFSVVAPQSIIDLGVGGGALIKAAINKWSDASYFVADIDKKSIENIKSELPFVNAYHLNTLKCTLFHKLKAINGSVDLAVCNPPYLRVKHDSIEDGLFENSKLAECKKLRYITSDIVFLAKNIQLLKQYGQLGIILPDTLITGKDFYFFRKAILTGFNIKAIIQLPEKIFSRTEALTHVLILEKSSPVNQKVSLLNANKQGQIISQIDIEVAALLERMDFKYHYWKSNQGQFAEPILLSELQVIIKRGNLTHDELRSSGDFYIHTTNMKNKKANQALTSHTVDNKKYILTEKGDILLARVGRGCIGKVCMISRGKVPITDCIFLLRTAKSDRQQLWDALISDKGQAWLKAISHGVCAKVISKKDLLNFPVYKSS